MKYGLVELHVDLDGLTAPSATDAVMAGIRRDGRRADTARAAVEHARRLGCGFVLLPGWTVVADEPPGWLLGLSAGVTVVAECLRPAPASGGVVTKAKATPKATATAKGGAAGPREGEDDSDAPAWNAYVIRDGEVVVGPARQCFAESGQMWDGEQLSEVGAELVGRLREPAPSGRRWSVPGVGPAMLLLCGEANVVAGGGPSGCWHYQSVAVAGLSEAELREVCAGLATTHTRSGPQALRDKRAWLSRGGILLHTANTHSGGWRKSRGTGEGTVAGRASHSAACAWVRGEAVELDLEVDSGEGYVVRTLEWGP